MLEGRDNQGGWVVVGLAIIALVAFTGLLYVRGASGPPIALSGSTGTARPSPAITGSSSSPSGGSSARPAASRSPGTSAGSRAPSGSGVVAGATSRPSSSASRSPKPAAISTGAPTGTSAPTTYRLPSSPQAATVALQNSQGDCPNFEAVGDVIETSFSLTSAGRLTVRSPSDQRLSGRVEADGAFMVAGTNPVERWVGNLTQTGGIGSYFIENGDCTVGYETTIAFHP